MDYEVPLYIEATQTLGIPLKELLDEAGFTELLDLNNEDLLQLLLSHDPVVRALKARGPSAREQLKREGVLVDEMCAKILKVDGRRHSKASRKHVYVGKQAGFGTARERIQLAMQSAALLQRLDPSLATLGALEPWHVAALYVWGAIRGLKHKTFNRMGTFWRDALIVMGKEPETYLPGRNEPILARLGVIDRHVPGSVDRGFKAYGQSAEEMVERFRAVDPRLGAAVELGRVLYLRNREMVSFQPRMDYNVLTGRVHIRHGTKGGRRRFGDGVVDPLAVRRAVEAAFGFANVETGSLIPDGYTRARWMRRLRRVAEKLGYTRRARGVTLYSLRHAGAHAVYEAEAGVPPPVAGGPPASEEADARGRRRATRILGHGRPTATVPYLGKSEHRPVREPASGARPSASEREALRHPFVRRRKRRSR